MVNKNRKLVDLEAREIHTRICRNVRYLMDQAEPYVGILQTAKEAEIGVGSLQSILKDPDHSPSVRILNRLVKHFRLPGIGTLTDGELSGSRVAQK